MQMQTHTFALTAELRMVANADTVVQARAKDGSLVWLRFSGDALSDARTSILQRWKEIRNWISTNAAERMDDDIVFVMTNVRMETTLCEDGSHRVHSWSYPTLQGWKHRPVQRQLAESSLAA